MCVNYNSLDNNTLLQHVFSNFDVKTLSSMCKTDKRNNKFFSDDNLWRIILEKDFPLITSLKTDKITWRDLCLMSDKEIPVSYYRDTGPISVMNVKIGTFIGIQNHDLFFSSIPISSSLPTTSFIDHTLPSLWLYRSPYKFEIAHTLHFKYNTSGIILELITSKCRFVIEKDDSHYFPVEIYGDIKQVAIKHLKYIRSKNYDNHTDEEF